MKWCLTLIAVAACWTGPVAAPPPAAPEPPPPARPAAPRLELSYRRTACMGTCPVFRVDVHPDGTVEWRGERFVAAVGDRSGHATRADLAAISAALDRARFFERDRYGHFPVEPTCTRTGNTTTCSAQAVTFCTDTPHTRLAVRRGRRTHRIDDAHCDDDPSLRALEDTILDRTHVRAWIGR